MQEMALTPEARGEIVEEAKRRALKDMGKPVSELASEEKRQAGNLTNDYAVQMLKDAHDFKMKAFQGKFRLQGKTGNSRIKS